MDIKHGKTHYLSSYDWNEKTGMGTFTYVDRATGEVSQLYRKQWDHLHIPKGHQLRPLLQVPITFVEAR